MFLHRITSLPYLAQWLVAVLPAPLIQGGGHLVHILPRSCPPGWGRSLAGPWAYRGGHLVDVLVLSLGPSWGLAGGSWRESAWARGDLVQTLWTRFGAVGGGHHVDGVRVGLCGAGGGVGRMHGRVLCRMEGLVGIPRGGSSAAGRRRRGGWLGVGAQRGEGSLGGGTGSGWLWRRRRGLLLLAVVHADQDLEAVAGDDALATMERAEPPAIQTLRVPLQHRHDVPLTEGQLVRRLRHIVVQRLGQHVLQEKDRYILET